jgi:hypothetical protein
MRRIAQEHFPNASYRAVFSAIRFARKHDNPARLNQPQPKS